MKVRTGTCFTHFKKNKFNEPAIVPFDHGDCDMNSNEPFQYGFGVVIRELARWVRDIEPSNSIA